MRADSHYCAPETLDFCRANGLDFIFGVAPTPTLRAHILALETRTRSLFEAASGAGKARRYADFFDGAKSWRRTERVIARIEAGPDGVDTRFVVTNLSAKSSRLWRGNLDEKRATIWMRFFGRGDEMIVAARR